MTRRFGISVLPCRWEGEIQERAGRITVLNLSPVRAIQKLSARASVQMVSLGRPSGSYAIERQVLDYEHLRKGGKFLWSGQIRTGATLNIWQGRCMLRVKLGKLPGKYV
jgi:hypothetical protein